MKMKREKYYKDALCTINKPCHTAPEKQIYKRIACVFQGGGALGAYQVGAFRAIHERGYEPNYLAGVSIGAINSAIIAGNQNLQSAITILGQHLTPEAQKNYEIQKILQLGNQKRFSVVHIIYRGTPFAHSFKDYNFGRSVINLRLETGYKNAMSVLDNPEWEKQSTNPLACSIYGVPPDYFEQQ